MMSIHRSLRCFAAILPLVAFAVSSGPPGPCAAQEKSAAAKPSARAAHDVAEVAAWRKQLLQLRELFVVDKVHHHETYDLGRAKVAAIDDPVAVPAIVKLLETEEHAQFRRALVQPLITIGGRDAVACLVQWSVQDPNPLFRQDACHGLVEQPELADFLGAYLEYLKPVKQGLNVRFATEAAEALTMTGLAAPLEDDGLRMRSWSGRWPARSIRRGSM